MFCNVSHSNFIQDDNVLEKSEGLFLTMRHAEVVTNAFSIFYIFLYSMFVVHSCIMMQCSCAALLHILCPWDD